MAGFENTDCALNVIEALKNLMKILNSNTNLHYSNFAT